MLPRILALFGSRSKRTSSASTRSRLSLVSVKNSRNRSSILRRLGTTTSHVRRAAMRARCGRQARRRLNDPGQSVAKGFNFGCGEENATARAATAAPSARRHHDGLAFAPAERRARILAPESRCKTAGRRGHRPSGPGCRRAVRRWRRHTSVKTGRGDGIRANLRPDRPPSLCPHAGWRPREHEHVQ